MNNIASYEKNEHTQEAHTHNNSRPYNSTLINTITHEQPPSFNDTEAVIQGNVAV